MSQLYLYNDVDIITKSAKSGFISFAESDEQRMMLMGLNSFKKHNNYTNVAALKNSIAQKVNKENAYCV